MQDVIGILIVTVFGACVVYYLVRLAQVDYMKQKTKGVHDDIAELKENIDDLQDQIDELKRELETLKRER